MRTRLAHSTLGGLVGLLAAATAIGIGELLAAAVRPQAAPVIAVGGAAVDRTPRPLKEFAIRQFGENDKHVLVAGIVVTLALFAIVVGIVARHRPVLGVVGVGLFGVIGAAAALTRPTARVADVLPSVAGAVAAVGALLLLLRTLRSRGATADELEPLALVPAAATAGEPAASTSAAGKSVASKSVASKSVASKSVGGKSAAGKSTGGTTAGDRSAAGAGSNLREELVRVDRKRGATVDRRGFLVTSAAVGAVAALATVAGRTLQGLRFDAVDLACRDPAAGAGEPRAVVAGRRPDRRARRHPVRDRQPGLLPRRHRPGRPAGRRRTAGSCGCTAWSTGSCARLRRRCSAAT